MEQSTVATAFDYLRSQILNFTLLPGIKISDDETAKVLGMSRTPVREALNRLMDQGLVEARHNRGFFVKIFTKKEVEDNYVLRESLECLAVRMAIPMLDPDKISTLRELLSTYPDVMKSNNLAQYNQVDEQFHHLIAKYSSNSALYDTLQNIQGRIRIIRRYDHLRTTSFLETYEEHEKILDQMIRRDTQRAVEAMSQHILCSMKTVIEALAGYNCPV
jgi:DNA-binding GntR family transcriptional regulator